MKIQEIETPALVIKKEALEANMAAIDEILKGSGMKLYPHYKTNKCPEIVKRQLERGAAGITCAKLGEAMDLADAGVKTIVIANQVVQKEKLPKLADLALKTDLTVCADSAENVLDLEAAMAGAGARLKVLVEYEVGLKRCGVETYDDFLALAKLIDAQPHLAFEGIQAYAGHIAHETNASYRRQEVMRIEKDVACLKEFVEKNGLPVANVCGGSTGFAADKPKDTVYTQLQTGSYLFMDSTYGKLALSFVQSLFVLTTVISVKQDRVVVDTGIKTVTMDQNPPYFLKYPDAPISFSEEHMAISVLNPDDRLGDKLLAVPGHCCSIMNNHDKVYVVSGDEVVDIWPIVSRGKSI